jgi:SAM-dependent methyltransferase
MTHRRRLEAVQRHWERDGLAGAVLEALRASGTDLEALTVDDLAPLDQFHGGGLAFTRRLATFGGLGRGWRVLDVGGGLGGPARTLAAEFGCRVTVVDLAESYVEAGRMLTDLMGLTERVTFHVGDALDLPFEDGAFDVVWTQNSGMNISDKERMYTGFRRVVRVGGRLVTQEPMTGPGGPPVYPLMWATDPTTDHLWPPEAMGLAIEGAGFHRLAWEEVTVVRPVGAGQPIPKPTVQGLVMGAERSAAIMAAAARNEREGRVVMVHAVFAAGA